MWSKDLNLGEGMIEKLEYDIARPFLQLVCRNFAKLFKNLITFHIDIIGGQNLLCKTNI